MASFRSVHASFICFTAFFFLTSFELTDINDKDSGVFHGHQGCELIAKLPRFAGRRSRARKPSAIGHSTPTHVFTGALTVAVELAATFFYTRLLFFLLYGLVHCCFYQLHRRTPIRIDRIMSDTATRPRWIFFVFVCARILHGVVSSIGITSIWSRYPISMRYGLWFSFMRDRQFIQHAADVWGGGGWQLGGG